MKKGFSIVELIVVIAIIGVLATISAVSYSRSKMRTRDAKRIADLNSVAQSILVYKEATDSYPANLCPNTGQKMLSYLNKSCNGVIGTPAQWSLGVLVTGNYISSLPSDPKVADNLITRDYWYFNDTVPSSMRGPILAAKLELSHSGGWVYPGPISGVNPIEPDCKMQTTTTENIEVSGTGSTTTTYSDPVRYCVKVQL